MNPRAGPRYGGAAGRATGAPASERPPKRRRVNPSEQSPTDPPALSNIYHKCLEKQVFPHINHAIGQLATARVDQKKLRDKVLDIVTGPTSLFEEQFRIGKGALTQRFEGRLSQRVNDEVSKLCRQPQYQLPPPKVTPIQPPAYGISAPPSSLPAETPPQNKTSPFVPRQSTSPVPPPIPGPRAPSRSSSLRNSITVGRPEEPILIDDDEPALSTTRATATTSTPKPATPVAPSVKRINQVSQNATPKTGLSPASLMPSTFRTGPQPTSQRGVGVPRVRATNSQPSLSSLAMEAVETAASIWDTSEEHAGNTRSTSKWFSRWRPYLSEEERKLTLQGAGRLMPRDHSIPTSPVVIHVDFTPGELEYLRTLVRKALREVGLEQKDWYRDSVEDLRRLWRKNKPYRKQILDRVVNALPRRSRRDLGNFFHDLARRRVASEPTFLSLGTDETAQQRKFVREARVPSLLFKREIAGTQGPRSMRRLMSFKNDLQVCREDDFELRAEWTDCAGDVITIVWTSNDGFICGTTEHSDSHNQQYNKPGNLVFGSCKTGRVQANPEHRIVRPIVENGQNASREMQQSQDPWLYSSVVSSDYDPINKLAFTSGFDRTVKIWDVESGSMRLVGEWVHGGNVNFVAASKDGSGMVATASDVAEIAVRIYHIDRDNVCGSPYRSYSCSRVTDFEGNTVSTEKWAYFPSTIQWGRANGAEHLLLIGYSPRSRTGDDHDIPEDRRHTGELCLWDGWTGERWKLTSATTQDVFEVMWHPTQMAFIAATTPLVDADSSVRTQIRIFRPSKKEDFGEKAFSPFQALDCTAADINELTIMPNGYSSCYITAGCTDGNVYVWDTAQGDRPIHILSHDESVEELLGNREIADVGVKFTAWGNTLDRFYTGSSDGVIKVWNIRSLGKPFVQNLLKAPAPISCGMFSPDKTRLLIGDASGRIFLLSLDDGEIQKPVYQKIPLPDGTFKTVRLPTPITSHPQPPSPRFDAGGNPREAFDDTSLQDIQGARFLLAEQLVIHPNPTIGVVQGPRYSETGLFRREAHYKGDPSQPLLAVWASKQQQAGLKSSTTTRQFRPMRLVEDSDRERKIKAAKALDLDLEALTLETRRELEAERAELVVDEADWEFDYTTGDEESWGDMDEEEEDF